MFLQLTGLVRTSWPVSRIASMLDRDQLDLADQAPDLRRYRDFRWSATASFEPLADRLRTDVDQQLPCCTHRVRSLLDTYVGILYSKISRSPGMIETMTRTALSSTV